MKKWINLGKLIFMLFQFGILSAIYFAPMEKIDKVSIVRFQEITAVIIVVALFIDLIRSDWV